MRNAILVYIIAINIVCFFGVVADKRLAASGPYGSSADANRRTAEVALVSRAALGGAPGTSLGFLAANHKTSPRKVYLRRAVRWTLVENIVLYALALSWARSRDEIRRSRRASGPLSGQGTRRRATPARLRDY